MKTQFKLLMSCLFFSLLYISDISAQSLCGDIPIDDFSGTTVTSVDVNEAQSLVEVLDDGGAGTIGRFRSITLERLAGFGPSDGATLLIEVGLLSLSNDASARSRANILYDADGDGLGLDLSTRELLNLSVLNLDNGISLSYVLTDENANQASLTELVPPISNPIEVPFLFENFSGIQAIDLANIESVELIIESTVESADLLIDAVRFGCQGTPPEFVAVPAMNRYGYVAMALLLLLFGLLWSARSRARV